MEPQVEYARTDDGVSIACWAAGEGHPLVWLPPMPGHVGLEWSAPVLGRQYRALTSRYRLVRYDGRDMGLSGRTGQPWTPDAFEHDLNAVSDHLRAPRFAMLANGPSCLGAIPYAARHPERVTHLVLNECFASFSEMTAESSAVRAMAGLIRDDYRVYTETIALQFFGWEQHDAAREYAELMRRSQTHEEAIRYMSAFMSLDVSAILEQITVPTVVSHHRDATLVPMSTAQSLASRIPGARLVVLEGDTVAGLRDDRTEAAALDRFVLGAETSAAPPAAPIPSGTAVILFADIADSTQLTEELGDAAFRAQARDLDALLRRIIREGHGATIEGKLVGDGVMAAFASAHEAIAAAVRCNRDTDSTQLRLHIGLHAGDVIHEGSNVYGGAVNLAARVAQEAAPGEVLVSDVVRTLARTSAGVRFEDRGERELKGVSDVQRLWAVVAET